MEKPKVVFVFHKSKMATDPVIHADDFEDDFLIKTFKEYGLNKRNKEDWRVLTNSDYNQLRRYEIELLTDFIPKIGDEIILSYGENGSQDENPNIDPYYIEDENGNSVESNNWYKKIIKVIWDFQLNNIDVFLVNSIEYDVVQNKIRISLIEK